MYFILNLKGDMTCSFIWASDSIWLSDCYNYISKLCVQNLWQVSIEISGYKTNCNSLKQMGSLKKN